MRPVHVVQAFFTLEREPGRWSADLPARFHETMTFPPALALARTGEVAA
jgi:hypothetical protein